MMKLCKRSMFDRINSNRFRTKLKFSCYFRWGVNWLLWILVHLLHGVMKLCKFISTTAIVVSQI